MSLGSKNSLLVPRSFWNPGTLATVVLSLVMATGCRGCWGGKKHKAKKKSAKVVAKKPGKPISEMINDSGPKGKIKALPLKLPTAEETREVAPEVAAARDLILKNDAASLEAGRTQLTEFVKINATDADAHYWMGRSFMSDTSLAPAIDAYKLAIQHDEAFVGARQWASIAMHKEKQCADAIVHLSMVMDARPDDLEAVYNRAICKAVMDDWAAALPDLTRYCEANAEPFCADVKSASEIQTRATGKRQVPTEAEREEYRRKKEAGELNPKRAELQKKIHGE